MDDTNKTIVAQRDNALVKSTVSLALILTAASARPQQAAAASNDALDNLSRETPAQTQPDRQEQFPEVYTEPPSERQRQEAEEKKQQREAEEEFERRQREQQQNNNDDIIDKAEETTEEVDDKVDQVNKTRRNIEGIIEGVQDVFGR